MSLAPNKVSVLLNVYKRPEMLQLQLDALAAQTYKVSEVLIWNNGNDIQIKNKNLNTEIKCKFANCNANLGVWARFAFALNSSSEFLCILDDDVIPGDRWIENCMTCFSTLPGLYGARGLIFDDSLKYTPNRKFGWGIPSEETIKVDIVGHAWFLKTEWLSHYWGETDLNQTEMHSGEDMQLSFALQRTLGIETFVPPHPSTDRSLWGNIAIDQAVARDQNAISLRPGAFKKFDTALMKLRKRGFLAFQNDEHTKVKINTRLLRTGLKTEYWNKDSITYKIGRLIAKQLRRFGIHI